MNDGGNRTRIGVSNQNQKRGRRNNNNNNNGGGGRRGGGNPARQNYDSNGPGVRIRGNATQIQDKYLQLARDAQGSGDRVLAENMLQHAEHYYRILNADSGDRGGRSNQHQGQPQMPNAAELTQRGDQDDDAGNRRDDADGSRREQASGRDQGTDGRDDGDTAEGDGGGRPARAQRGRGRGRPRREASDEGAGESGPVAKSGTDATNEDGTGAGGDSPKQEAADATDTGGTDAGGTEAGATEAAAAESAPPKRGRGRPRKNPDAPPRRRRTPSRDAADNAADSEEPDDAGVRAILGAD
ncbi:DUF4167 domain-containing protein [Marivibrio halodurans]|uniref:DUF4167 domain-containing protein n=2 Tax=Marivibrio halodurans TaxID=2039722 RepID=A0A8J7V333_9PROT|nr:DUF4167 domain-containing protein [Marivibrio halodurans]